MNSLDVIFFQAENTPEKIALVAHGAIIPYARVVLGTLSAQQRLTAIGVTEGQTVGLHMVHPIDHFVMACALYRVGVTTASMTTAPDLYLDNVPFDLILSDNIIPTASQKQPRAKFVLADPSWFQDKVTVTVADRTVDVRNSKPDWVCRIVCLPSDGGRATVVKTTSRELEAQIVTQFMAMPADWERLISISGLGTVGGFQYGLMALRHGRTVCYADVYSARNLISSYKHHCLVGAAQDVDALIALQQAEFVNLNNLRGAYVSGRSFEKSFFDRCLTMVSSNTRCGYVHPRIGVVAFGDAARLLSVDGAAGFVAPWTEAQIVGPDRNPLATEMEGELRFRLRPEAGQSPNNAPQAEWIYPGQRARIMKNNLLVISGLGMAA